MTNSLRVKPHALFNLREPDAYALLLSKQVEYRVGMRDGAAVPYEPPTGGAPYMLLSVENGIVRGAVCCDGV